MHHSHMERVRFFIMQGPEELFSEGVCLCLRFNPDAIVAEVIPVVDQPRENRQHTVDRIQLTIKVVFCFQIAQHRATGTHNIHRVSGCRNVLQHRFQGVWQLSQPLQTGLVGAQFLSAGQFAMWQ